MNETIKEMIRLASEDGVITDEEKAIILRKAKALGEDEDIVELAIETVERVNKENTILTGEKCPNCRSTIPSGSSVCPQCGFAFSKVGASKTSMELQKDLFQIDKELNDSLAAIGSDAFGTSTYRLKREACVKKNNRITSTVIPNSKDDLVELMAFAATKANKNDMEQFGNGKAYWALFSNCVLMAKNFFPDDPSFQHFYEKYDSENVSPYSFQNLSKKNRNKNEKGSSNFFIKVFKINCIVFVIVLVLILIWFLF